MMLSIPIIMIKGTLKDIQTLFDIYMHEGYNIKIVGNMGRAYLYGVEYVTDAVDIHTYWHYWNINFIVLLFCFGLVVAKWQRA